MKEESISFDDILDDIDGIVSALQDHGSLSYSDLQRQLSWSPRLHLIHYIRFFESMRWLSYDRVSERVELLEGGWRVGEESEHWERAARSSFAPHLTEGDELLKEGAPPPGSPAELDVAIDDDYTDPDRDVYDDDGATPDELDDDQTDLSSFAPLAPEPLNIGAAPAAKPSPFEHDHDKDNPMTSDSPYPSSSSAAAAQDPYTARAKSAAEGLYERHEEVGSGGVGTVYRGVQTRLERPVAIKEIRNIFHVFADVQRDDIVRRFVEIVRTQATLDHPNIIQVHDVVYDTDYPYVVMQWAPKGSLRRLIDFEGRPPLNVAMSYFLQILHALNAAHDQQIVHGGLKPENVVLDPAGNAMLTDFGMTQVAERASRTGGGHQVYVGVGTVAYLSPEQFHNPNLATIQSDIYSLGIMFYEMLTGKVPGRRSPMPSSFFPDIPRKLDDIFDRMCMDDTEDRYQSVRAILKEIYASPEVLDIMDKRSGVLFLRDPIVHGELGLEAEPLESVQGVSDADTPAAASYTVEGAYPSYEQGEEGQEEEQGDEASGLASESSAEELGDRLDQYSALFEDDDDDS